MSLALLTALPARSDTSAAVAPLLQKAEAIKLKDRAEFMRLLDQLDHQQPAMTAAQRWHVIYLQGWRKVVDGDLNAGAALLKRVIDQSTDKTLRFRARATLINVLDVSNQFEPAYQQLDELLRELPEISDWSARFQGIGEAAQLLVSAGQSDLALHYARIGLESIPEGESTCLAQFSVLNAMRVAETVKSDDPAFQSGIDACVKDQQFLWADSIRLMRVKKQIDERKIPLALQTLRRFHAEVLAAGYGNLVTKWDSALAEALYRTGKLADASRYALEGLPAVLPATYSSAIASTYRVLYQAARQRGDFAEALQWHEKYMAAEKGYLDSVSASYLAYQRVKQQVDAKQRQLAVVASQNKILKLQQELDRKAVETGRLYIALLLVGLVLIVLLLIRLKHSQLRFMRLARSDGLTGILNRQHFVDEAGKVLRQAERAGSRASLILLDMDHFKLVNDTHGHAVGDEVLKRAVAMSHKFLRPGDIFGRLGGEEFAILLPDGALEHVVARAEQIREAIASVTEDTAIPGIVMSASFGVSTTDASGYELQQLLIDADRALYCAKREGRNRVVASTASSESSMAD